jgi:hypothetical protein
MAQDMPRHLGQHSGGMVICQGQLDSVVPLEPAAMPGRVVVQWDKEDCADMGIIKVDLLGLGMMAVIQDSLKMIPEVYGEPVDLARLPQNDPAVYRALQQGRHHRHVPGGKPRANVLSAAHEAAPLLRHRGAGGDHPAGADRGQNGASLFEPAPGPGSGRLPAPLARAGAAPHARRAAVSGAVAEDGDDRRWIQRRRSRGTAPRHGIQTLGKTHGGSRRAAARRHGVERHHWRGAGDNRAFHHRLRAVRFSGIARGQLCPAGLRQRVFEVPLPGGVHLRHAEQPADGVLLARRADQRCAAARPACAAGGRDGIGLGLHGGKACAAAAKWGRRPGFGSEPDYRLPTGRTSIALPARPCVSASATPRACAKRPAAPSFARALFRASTIWRCACPSCARTRSTAWRKSAR